jgi:hypothetical protein
VRARIAIATGALALLCLWAAPAGAALSGDECLGAAPGFGFCEFEATFAPQPGEAPLQAGSHPEEFEVFLSMSTEVEPEGPNGKETIPSGEVKDLRIAAPPGFLAAPTAVPACSTVDFLSGENLSLTNCPAASAVGTTTVEYQAVGTTQTLPVYSLQPAPGTAAKIGFVVEGVAPVTVDLLVSPKPPHNGIAEIANVTQVRYFFASTTTLWGVPAAASHDDDRGACLLPENDGEECPVALSPRAFLTLPARCSGPLVSEAEADSWQRPGEWAKTASETAGASVGCARLPFEPEVSSQPTTDRAAGASGLAFGIDVDDPGLTDPQGKAASQVKETLVRLPEGMTLNPSAAEGLGVCTPGQYEAEQLSTEFGSGCPAAAKLGSVEVETDLLEGTILRGEVFLAAPGANPFDSLLAIYITVRERERGVFVKLAGEVEPDPRTGQLTTTVKDIPQLPFSAFRFRFREGARAPLITPNACGSHTTEVELTPWADPSKPIVRTDSFEISSGPGGGPCPPGGAPPFAPGFQAGTLQATAGSHSPFLARFTRKDGEQDMTRFSFTLPEGLLGKIAGVGRCPDAAIALARAKSGRAEQAAPSCPPNSLIGSVLGGAGVGAQLTHVPGHLYMAGPVGTAPLSIVALVPAVAGPFDVGNVVTRVALKLNPLTAQVEVDGANSEPLPHILAGIPLRVRDVRVNTDRPGFTLNPTDCEPKRIAGLLWGGGADPFSPADDAPVALAAPFAATDCAALGFGPRLKILLRGGPRRGAHPALRAVVRPRPGQANFARAVVTLPRSAFLEQAHIRTICTRVQFAAGPGNGALCPKGARYGYARAWSPLLEGPAQGPVFLRSSDNNLPDLVAALTGPPSAPVDFELSARIDSVRGGIRSTFARIPDVPVSRFVLNMQGGKKGLIVNSRHLCHKPGRNRARANLKGQNGRLERARPRVVALKCAKRRKARRTRRGSG